MSECTVCGTHFIQHVGGGRPREYCSSSCKDVALGKAVYATHLCEQCGATFTGHKRTFCSVSCRNSAANARRTKPKSKRTCQRCGVEFETHQSSARFCSKRCRYLWRDVHVGHGTRTCEICGAEFIARDCSQRTCGGSCRWLLHMGYLTGPHTCDVRFEKWACRIPTDRACRRCGADITDARKSHRRAKLCADCFNLDQRERDWENGSVQAHRVCVVCGKRYHKRDGFNSICSRECQRVREATNNPGTHTARAKHFGVAHAHVNHRKVFERDSYVCHICGRTTDWYAFVHREWDAHVPNRLYPTLDHVVPLSRGGPHVYSNVACACWECNIEKADKLATA